jgi:sporulation protein YlmC with PRC-barrel domain/DNA-directed RNA polymerase subunit RPC12/RpoP
MMTEDMAEKKLRGSGGYAIARITDEEQKKGNLGGPELFLAGIGRLEEDRFVKYHCNKCEKEYEGSPAVTYENPNEELGEGVTLIEKGEYKCRTCSATIAQYRKFDTVQTQQQQQQQAPASPQAQTQQPAIEERPASADIAAVLATTVAAGENYFPIQSLVGMSAYDSEAMLIGRIKEVGLRRTGRTAQITIKIGEKEVPWDGISKIGDIVLLKTAQTQTTTASTAGGMCPACGFQNESDSVFCADCGSRL